MLNVSLIKHVYILFIDLLGKIKWEFVISFFHRGRYFKLTHDDHQKIMDVLKNGNYFILTRRDSHLSTYACCFINWWLTGRWGYWSHFCMNIESAEDNLLFRSRILESIGSGVQISNFMQVFNCDSVCILRPIMPEGIDWESLIESELGNVGKTYDDYFNLNDDGSLSCVEIGFSAIKKIPDYHRRFHGLLAMIKNNKNLTPDMYYDSGSFEVVLEIKGKW